MTVETLGEAWRAGWRVKARCAHGKRDGMKSIRECHREYELEMETLVWTRGAGLPLGDLAGRLRCPACRSLKVAVAFMPPPIRDEGGGRASSPREDMAALPHRVELYRAGGTLDRMVAASADSDVARAAFHAAIEVLKLEVGQQLVLRRFGQLVAQHPEPEPSTEAPAVVNAEIERVRAHLPKGRERRWK
ncbi:hypothetical protein ACIKT0_00710 [Hansschlegelia beijingensis]|uniref:hypothetical protein n=1 Tax=Hansschlegelia beijingensis TaxID=1133344 RepID=UPI00387EF6DC